ncbi:DUF1127 domain-containing protein [Granulosicoccus antarcticus]|uniref:YjiS-like domain-containing protein n=1 Tax=Granulosicoccus antarcticus IMCC3135 TaxID=1192854 RepID=A0A2Z2NV84_9GAMM|nr:DUF1127 domain-containing protein [Granulosicoccus antarcticus]ASJ73628.1 hypothetical protein IMCC3135_17745 [Granulosicoccus antarcticus IMCC3135]
MFYGTYKLMMARYPSALSLKKLDTESHAFANVVGRRRARRALLTKSDHMLADMGFSRELLEQGVKAWPWLVATDTTEQLVAIVPAVAPMAHQTDVVSMEEHPEMEQQRYAA